MNDRVQFSQPVPLDDAAHRADKPLQPTLDAHFVLRALHRQKRLITVAVIAGMIATTIALLGVTPRYTSTASVLLDTHQRKVLGSDSVLPARNLDSNIIESEMAIFRSTPIAKRVLAEFADEFAETGQWKWFRWPSWLPNMQNHLSGNRLTETKLATTSNVVPPLQAANRSSAPTPETKALARLLKPLEVHRKGNSYIVEVSYTSKDRELATRIANAFVSAYLVEQTEAKSRAVRTANTWLKTRVAQLAAELQTIEKERQAFRADRTIVGVGDRSLQQKEISDSAQQLVAARSQAAEAEAALRQATALRNTDPGNLLSLEKALSSPVIGNFRRQQAEIQSRILEATSRYGASHPDAIRARAELSTLESEMTREADRILESLRLARDAAAKKVELLEATLTRQKKSIVAQGTDQIVLDGFEDRIKVVRELHAALLRRYKETVASETLQTADANVISYAAIPIDPSYPKKLLTLMLAGMGWMGLGMALAISREYTRQTLSHPSEVESAAGLSCIAAIPLLDPAGFEDASGEDRSLAGPIHWRPDEFRDEGFNQAIFAVRQWTDPTGAAKPTIAMIVGAHPAEGRSTLAIQLARYAATTGIRTLLVDADMRTCAATQALAIEPVSTYADYVSGRCDPADAIVSLEDYGMDFCPAPPRDETRPLDILGSRRMGDFLNAQRENYEFVVVDTAPMDTYADADALMHSADQAIVVAKADQTRRDDLFDVSARINASPNIAAAAVLNMVRTRK